jgi:hypothetical protein
MDKKIKLFFMVFYSLSLIGVIRDFYLRITSRILISDALYLKPNLISTLFGLFGIVLFCLSVVSIIISFKFKLPKYTYIYPIFLFILVTWNILIPLLLYGILGYIQAVPLIDRLDSANLVFYIVQIVILLYVLYKLVLTKKGNK